MNPNEKFLRALQGLAKMCGAILDPYLISLYERALAPHGYERCVAAVERFILERKARDPFPSIADFRAAMGIGELSERAKAEDVANRLCKAISKYGYIPSKDDLPRLKEYVGEVGWYIVEQRGGWPRFCEETDTLRTLEFFRNGLVKDAETVLEKSRLGCLEEAPRLPQKPVAALRPAVPQSGHDEPPLQNTIARARAGF